MAPQNPAKPGIPAEIAHQAAELRREIARHDRLYYVEAHPEITDAAYDRLFDELADLESRFPGLATPDSPTARVGGSPIEGFPHVRHDPPMLSLDKARDADELDLFEQRVRKILGDAPVTYHVEPKIDGVSLAVQYRNGRMIRAATRGDGAEGDDITSNARTIRSLPLTLATDHPPEWIEVRGEAYMDLAGFERLNHALTARGEAAFPNPRNATAGSLKQLNPRVVAGRPLRVVFYAVARTEGIVFTRHDQALDQLRAWGLPVPPSRRVCPTMRDALAAANEIKASAAELPFAIDGAVIKVNELEFWDRLGLKSRSPAYAIAYKPREWIERTETRLRAITLQIGRTGAVTPVAELEPVFLDGSTISRATLHNAEDIARKDIRVGDRVVIEKAGMVIPAVIAPRIEKRTGREQPFVMPSTCPACGGPLARRASKSGEAETVAHYCDNLQCPAQKPRRLDHFAQRKALDIQGIGGVVAEKLVERGLVEEPLDLFRISKKDLRLLDLGEPGKPRMFGENADKVIQALERSRTMPLERWLLAMAIPEIGETLARALGRGHRDLDDLANSRILRAIVELSALREEAAAINPRSQSRRPRNDQERAERAERHAALQQRIALLEKETENPAWKPVGPVAAQAVLDFFASPRGRDWRNRLQNLGIHPTNQPRSENPAVRDALAGCSMVITGTLSGFSREAATEAVRARGGTVTSAVSGKTSYVVAGRDPGANKLADARKLGVPVISESEWRALLQLPPAPEEPRRVQPGELF
ncbi:MAG: NAD-dependent DNA ligase LigA [Kiritimatiellae bacterium]|nr:NAD-dependent DNA ligase LigA [Kiritimatiellia bacterium]